MNIVKQALALNAAEALEAATVYVDRKAGPSTTVYTLTGKPKAVQCKIDALMREWDPLGYGSTVKLTETGAIFTRYNSCD